MDGRTNCTASGSGGVYLKWSGMALLIGAGTAFGFYKAYGYRRRVADIILLQNAFQLLETEIFYTITPVPVALKRLEDRISPILQPFFHQVWYAMEQEQLPVYQAWEQGIAFLEKNTFCSAEELATLRNFGCSLGEGDLVAQQKNFQLLQQRLQYALEHAERLRLQQGCVWQYLGVCISVAIAILLC